MFRLLLRLRSMTKHLRSVAVLACLIPVAVLAAFFYSDKILEVTNSDHRIWSSSTQDTSLSHSGHAIRHRASFAYKKRDELNDIDDTERESVTELDEDFQEFEGMTYRESLRRTADPSGHIIIKFCEEGRLDSVVNFHELSILKNEIQNVLYVSPDTYVCQELWKMEVKCHVLEEDFMFFNYSMRTLEEQRDTTKRLTIAKIKVILKALTSGYTVLFSDSKTLYVRNPLEAIECGDQCDVAFSMDGGHRRQANLAVQLAKPRHSAVYLYARLLTLVGTVTPVSVKDTLNKILASMMTAKQIKVRFLDTEAFSPASSYFTERRFYSDKSRCRACTAVFEDRGISHEDEVYQLKEQHLWYANFDEYYSSRRRLYLLYENAWDYDGKRSISQELLALRNALAIGHFLGRIVILPRFHCPPSLFDMKYCGLSDFLQMSYFDEKFGSAYREHTFLSHSKVSREVRRAKTDRYYLGEVIPDDEPLDKDSEIKPRHKVVFLEPRHSHRGITVTELKAKLDAETSYNLYFHSLYEGFAGLEDKAELAEFNSKIKYAFRLTPQIQTIVGDKSFEFE